MKKILKNWPQIVSILATIYMLAVVLGELHIIPWKAPFDFTLTFLFYLTLMTGLDRAIENKENENENQ